MRSLRLVFLFVFVSILALVTTPPATKLLAQSSSVIADSPIQTPLASNNAAMNPVLRPDPERQAKTQESYGKLPLSFEANQGQADSQVRFLTRTGAFSLFLTGDEAVLALRERKDKDNDKDKFSVETRLASSSPQKNSAPTPDRATENVLRMKLSNANANVKVAGLDELAGKSNYFIGNDPAKWRANVTTYSKVRYEAIYSGIDLVFYGNQRQLEYDFIVAPGADPHHIAFDITGAKQIRKDARGDLVFKTGEGEIRWHRPVVYQEKDGTRQQITASYAITNTNRVGFEVAKYDPGRPLYIDPLVYSTYLGGSADDQGNAIAVDSVGYAYVTGSTPSTDFPTMNPLQPNVAGGGDAFVTKINPSGSAFVYSTYLGGTGFDLGNGIAVDNAGNAYITGETNSPDFPTMNPLQPTPHGAFVTKIDPAGSALVYSTYLGGTTGEEGNAIAVDKAGNAYVAGLTLSRNFPTTSGAFQRVCNGGSGCSAVGDAFVSKINAAGSAFVYSTFLGGSNIDFSFGIAVDSAGNAYVTGATSSYNFPTKNPLQPHKGGTSFNAFVTKLNPSGSALVYSTYLGGSGPVDGDVAEGIAIDSAGNAYVAGATDSSNFPTTPSAFQTSCAILSSDRCGSGFVSKINVTGSALVYSTYLGGRGSDGAYGIAVDRAGSAYVTGGARSSNFPNVNALQKHNAGLRDAFVTRFNAAGSALAYSTYLGGTDNDHGRGIAVDNASNAYVVGSTNSTNFPTQAPLQPANGGVEDAFVAKLHISTLTTTRLSSSPNPSVKGQAVTFSAVVTSVLGAPPDGETVTFVEGTKVLGTGALSGGSASFSTSTLFLGTNVIRAVYGGDANFASSKSNTVSQVVNKATTTTTLASSLNPSNFGQSVTFTATLKPQFSGTVTGSVTFYDGTTALKTASLNGGVAKFTTSALTVGSHTITATYNGSTNFDGSSASLTQIVN